MAHRASSKLLLILLVLGSGSFALSQGDSEKGESGGRAPADTGKAESTHVADVRDSIIYAAPHIQYMVEERKVILFGGATARYRDISVEAETLIFDSKKKEIIALGNPVLHDGDQTIYGERMRYEIETGYGEIDQARTKIEKGWFEGKKTRKVGKRTLEIEEGTFTTCDRDPPHYFFAAARMKVYEDDMVVSEPLLMYVGDVPVFFMPYWFFPIKRERHSGFLLPKIGTDKNDGRYVKELSYFLVLNDYSDILLSADFLENRGLRSAMEAVYVVRPYFEGKISGSYIDEIYTEEKRWRVEANHMQNAGWRTSLRARADFQSDTDYEVDYNENRIVQLNRRLESYLSLTKTWSGAGASIVLNRTENLDTEEVSQLLPRASINLNDRRVFEPASEDRLRWYNLLRASLSAVAISMSHSEQGEQVVTRTGDSRLNLNMPIAVLGHVNLAPSLAVKETFYDSDTTSRGLVHRHHYTTAVGLNTTIYGLSRFGVGPLEGFRHVLRPSLGYSYAPAPEETLYGVSGISGASAANNLRVSIGNDFQAKLRGDGAPSILTLASLDVSTSYNMLLEDKKLSDISSYLKVNPYPRFEIDTRMSHDPYEDLKLTSLSTTVRFDLGGDGSGSKKWGGMVEGNYVRNIDDRSRDTYQVWGRFGFRPTDRWHVLYSQRYDIKEKEQIEQSLTVYRDLHGWEAQFEWQTFGESWRYDVRLNIKAIPEIKLGKGIFGVFLP